MLRTYWQVLIKKNNGTNNYPEYTGCTQEESKFL